MRALHIQKAANLPNHNDVSKIEIQIGIYKNIRNQIDILEIQLKQLKDEMFNSYFNNNTEYKNEFGQVIARRIDCETTYFNQSDFRKDHEDVYNMYTRKVPQTRFLVK